jgi:gamma-glutamylcyclotransferase (GGCT)/AIG2-like uncharacterized protein YtfP
MKYFAYGSNMLAERLCARVAGATVVGVASLAGRRLQFHKRSIDGSGKCDIPTTANPQDTVYGVLFEVPEDQLSELDRFEGAGSGYERITADVTFDGASTPAAIYIADAQHTDAALLPYDWYHDLVLAGARQNSLPADYVTKIAATATKPDPDSTRKTRLAAIEALKNVKTNATGNV